MRTADLWQIVQQKEAAGLEHVILVAKRARPPGGTVAPLPGLTGRCVGWERDGRTFCDIKISDLRRWLERRFTEPTTTPPRHGRED